MRSLAAVALLSLAAVVPVLDVLFAQPVTRKPRKVALVVGPSTYLHDFDKLNYTVADVEALAEALRSGGFDEVVVLTDPPEGKHPATRANILDQLEKLVAKQPNPANNVRRGDIVLVALSGHGLELNIPDPDRVGQTKREAFFAPVDGKKGKAETLIGLGYLVNDVLAPCGGRNLLLVDACREVYDPNKGKGIGGQSVSLTGQTAVLFSCSTTEQSWEAAAVMHGVFTYAVLEAVKESREAGKPLSWSGLVSRVEEKMGDDGVKQFIPTGKTQTPVLAAGQVPPTELFGVQVKGPNAGEERDFDIAKGVQMRFCWVPAGMATLGSPTTEKEREPVGISEAEHKFTTRGFWLGKYEVTQGQWTEVMGNNPSAFAATGTDASDRGRVKGLDTKWFPVEQVSWEDCQVFLKKANASSGAKRGRFGLPHEDEWEYACRGGKGNGQAFYWGNALNGKEANCNGDLPYGGTTKGPNLQRPEVVGSYARDYPHPWRLCDMHGNVWEWCENEYSTGRRALRGGSWFGVADLCRSANRGGNSPDNRSSTQGFRVCYRPD